jgi:hypothetical protein
MTMRLTFNSRRWLAIPGIAGFGSDKSFPIIGPANNTRLTTKSISPHHGRGTVGYDGGSCARAKTDVVRTLYLPLGGRRFRSRHAYRLAYLSQRETVYERAIRRARKLCRRLGGDLADDGYPAKPPRTRWVTYVRLLDKLIAAERVSDERMILLISKLGAPS